MKCQDFMDKSILAIDPNDSIQDAACKMREGNVDFLAVCVRDGVPIGTVTDRDLAVRAVADAWPASTPVAKAMSLDLVLCDSDQTLEQANELMRAEKASRVLCIDDAGALAGMISLADIRKKTKSTSPRELFKFSQF